MSVYNQFFLGTSCRYVVSLAAVKLFGSRFPVFSGIPVVDEDSRPIGIITQGDLIRRAGMPMRIGMPAQSSQEKKDAVLKSLSSKRVVMIMSSPAVSILV